MELIAASTQMTEAWKKMAKGPGLESYNNDRTINADMVKKIKDSLEQKELPKETANIPGINDIANYLRALKFYIQ